MARARTKRDAVTTAAKSAPKLPSQPVIVDISDIARRAYDLYQARGSQPGHDVDDWMQAEQELKDPLGSGIS